MSWKRNAISQLAFYSYIIFGVLCLAGSCYIIYLVNADPSPYREPFIYFITSLNFLSQRPPAEPEACKGVNRSKRFI
jgi:hypothetical protein